MKKSHHIISWFLLLLINVLLLFINSRLNTWISPWGVHLYWDGLLIAFPALNMRTPAGLSLMIVTGLLRDATLPTYFGQHMLIYSALFLFVRALQKRLNFGQGSVVHLVTQISNLILILTNSFTFLPSSEYWNTYLGQIFILILLSQSSLAFITLWFYQLQYFTTRYLIIRFNNRRSSQLQ